MRETRIFELGGHDAPVGWTVNRPQRLTAISGMLWVTVEGALADIWLQENQSLELPPKVKVWVSAGVDGSRFTVSRDVRRVLALSQRFRPLRLLGSW
jgi:Protein of unknown function (DUF2917)